jgi:hypothetical protein
MALLIQISGIYRRLSGLASTSVKNWSQCTYFSDAPGQQSTNWEDFERVKSQATVHEMIHNSLLCQPAEANSSTNPYSDPRYGFRVIFYERTDVEIKKQTVNWNVGQLFEDDTLKTSNENSYLRRSCFSVRIYLTFLILLILPFN